jgi:hypothetical protein
MSKELEELKQAIRVLLRYAQSEDAEPAACRIVSAYIEHGPCPDLGVAQKKSADIDDEL